MDSHIQTVINRLKPVLEKALSMQVSTFLSYQTIEALLVICTERKSYTIHILEENHNQHGDQAQLALQTGGYSSNNNEILVESLKTRLPDAILLLIKSNFPQNIAVQLSGLLYIGLLPSTTSGSKIIVHLTNVDLECTGQAFPFENGMGIKKKADPIDEYKPRFNNVNNSTTSSNSRNSGNKKMPVNQQARDYGQSESLNSLAKTIDEILDSDSDDKASNSLDYSLMQSSGIDYFANKLSTPVSSSTLNHNSPAKSGSKFSKFICVSCDKVYEDIEDYRNHVLFHLKDIEKVLASTYVATEQSSGDTKLYVCKICDTRFESLKTAGGHVRHRHLPNVSTQSSLTCPLCMNKYKCVYDCVYHIKTCHLKEKNYQCKFCSRKFAQKCNMTKHIKDVHENELPPLVNEPLPIIAGNLSELPAGPSSSSTTSSLSARNPPMSPKKDKLERLIVKIKKSSTGQHQAESTSPPDIKDSFNGNPRISHDITPILQRDDRKFITNTKMQCLGCSIKFENQVDFNEHIKIHLKKLEEYVPSTYAKILKGESFQKYECTFCNNRFQSIKSVCLHIAKNHLDMNEIKENRECLVCGLKGRATYDVVKHMEGVHLKEKHPCKICHKLFSRKATWVKHLKEVHLTSPEPDNDFDDDVVLKPPILAAIKAKKKLPIKDEFENGLLVEMDKSESMDVDDGLNDDESSFESDESSMYCQKCNESFDDSSVFKSHIRQFHLNDFEKSQADSYIVKVSTDYFNGFQCDICKENFKTRQMAISHATRRHYLAKEQSNQYECPVCSKNFDSNKSASQHLRSVHLGDTSSSATLSTPKNSTLTSNIQTSTPNSNDNRCPNCEKIFSNKWNLTRHMAEIHQKIKRFTCEMCPRTFSRQCDGLKHMQQMHMVDMYKKVEKNENCDKCKKKFSTIVRLNSHNRDKHLKKRFRCDVCGKQFMFPSQQYVHTNMKHTWA